MQEHPLSAYPWTRLFEAGGREAEEKAPYLSGDHAFKRLSEEDCHRLLLAGDMSPGDAGDMSVTVSPPL